eukprot:502707-Alexandrium_andersonii.AAC.1
MAKLEYIAFDQDFLIPARAEFDATNLHFHRVASFMLTCQQISQTSRQGEEEELKTVSFEINLNHFGKAAFNGCATIFNRLYVGQSLAVYNQPVQVT